MLALVCEKVNVNKRHDSAIRRLGLNVGDVGRIRDVVEAVNQEQADRVARHVDGVVQAVTLGEDVEIGDRDDVGMDVLDGFDDDGIDTFHGFFSIICIVGKRGKFAFVKVQVGGGGIQQGKEAET